MSDIPPEAEGQPWESGWWALPRLPRYGDCRLHVYPHRTAYACWTCRGVMIRWWFSRPWRIVSHPRYFVHDMGLSRRGYLHPYGNRS